MGMNINANHPPISLHYSVHSTPFNAKDVPILRDILRGNVLGKQFKGFIDAQEPAENVKELFQSGSYNRTSSPKCCLSWSHGQ